MSTSINITPNNNLVSLKDQNNKIIITDNIRNETVEVTQPITQIIGISFPSVFGSKGIDGTSGTSGTSGVSGTGSTSGTSGITGTSGTSGTNATGTSGTSGITGTSGTSGINATGTSGTSGITGTSGTSGISGGGNTFPYTGDAVITGSLTVTGNSTFSNDITIKKIGGADLYVGQNFLTGQLKISSPSISTVQIEHGNRVGGNLLGLYMESSDFGAGNDYDSMTLAGGGNSLLFFVGGGAVSQNFVRLGDNSDDLDISLAASGSGNLDFFYLNSGTNKIGINAGTNPSHTLEVQGEISASTYYGDGSNLSGIGSTVGFPYTGDAIITGSLLVSSSNGNITATHTGSFAQITANNIVADSLDLQGTGIPTIESPTNIILSASNAVVINNSPLRLNSYTNSETSSGFITGDVYFNSDTSKFMGYNGVNHVILG